MSSRAASGAAARLTLVTFLGVAGCSPRNDAPAADSAATASSAQAFRPLSAGDSVPPYAAPTLAGDTVRVAAGGPLTLVNVWATWCTSCREEMADLEALHRDYSARGVRVVAVSIDGGDPTRVRRFVEREKLTMSIALDPAGSIQQAFSVVGVPETLLIGRDGRLVWRQAGGLHGAPAAARSAIDRALAGAPAGESGAARD